MDTPRRSYCHTAPRSALLNVSNGQSASIRGSSSVDQHKTPSKESQCILSASAKRINLSIRRELSKSHGDLSNLRPKSPPIQSLSAGLHGLHLSPGNYVDDTQNFFSPSYNRQARHALPNDWMTSAAGSQPSTRTEGSATAGKQIYHSPLYGIHHSHHIEAEPAKVSIQGLTSGYIQPLDFCIPVTRSHPGDEDQRRKALHGDAGRSLAVEHVNISTAWNGLSDVDANELFRVHRAFVLTLEKMLANELWQIYQQFQQQDSAGNIRPIHTLFSAGIVRGISFCRDQLVSEMAEVLYSSKENMARAKSGFLRLYLIANDALVLYHEDGSRDTSITVRVRCDLSSPRPHPVVDAAWVPDSLVFEGLDEFPVEGQSFSIVPRYYSKSAFRPTHFPKNVKYSIESESRDSPLSWLVWDNEIAGFKGIVPFYSEVNSYDIRLANTRRDFCESNFSSLKIIVQAVLVDDNGSSVRYERILRARLTIKVVPWYANENSREAKERLGIPKTYQGTRLASAAQRFALQGPRGSPLEPGQSSSRLFQQCQGAHLYTPNEYIDLGQIKFKDYYTAMTFPPTGVGLNETDLPRRAQTQAYLVAKCAELTRELENVKEKVMMSGPFDEHHDRTLHVPDSQEYPNDTCRAPSYHHTRLSGPTSGSSVSCISHDASEHPTTPSSSFLHGRVATFQPGSISRFSVLPPPAIGLTALPTLESQTSTDGNVLDATCTGWDPTTRPSTTSQLAAPERGFLAQHTYPSDLWRLPEQAPISLNGTGTAHSPPQGKIRLRQSSSVFFSHRHASISSTSGSRSTSSDIELIVEQTPCARKVSRGEQARLWNLLSQSDSGKENQPRPEGSEVRLSEDEKKAMEEAMRRSLDDLAEGFDDIFQGDSSESNSSDDL